MSLGPLMLGLDGPDLTAEERAILLQPAVGGVILFSRNYDSPARLRHLCAELHALRHPRLLIAVDHEGGRVQRFRQGFTLLPAARSIGTVYDSAPEHARLLARTAGWLLAAELRACGVDFSFTPVLDLDHGHSAVIGDRAWHHDPLAVTALARAHLDGLHEAGMAAVGKHFPGHGAVVADSHHALPVDERPFEVLAGRDLLPFARLINELAAIMPAHIVYPAIDAQPAGYSARWLRDILRRQLGFAGLIISDDLDMVGAHSAGTPLARAQAALAAGCDMILACNDRTNALQMLDGLRASDDPATHLRQARLHGRGHPDDLGSLRDSPAWQEARRLLDTLASNPSDFALT